MRHKTHGMLAPTLLPQIGQPLGVYSSMLMPQGFPKHTGSSVLPQYVFPGPQGGANKSCLVTEPSAEDNR